MQWSLIHKETNTFLQWQQWTPSTINLRGTFFCVFMKIKKGSRIGPEAHCLFVLADSNF